MTAYPPAADYRAARDDLRELDRVDDANVWYGARPVRNADGRNTVTDDAPTRISVEARDADSSEFLNDLLKKHGLVISDFSCGDKGFRANLRFEGTVHNDMKSGDL